jgi:ABC-type sugar transport system ATPase subunit
MTLADRICLMKKGEIQQVASPREIYERPATSFVASFIGAPKMHLLEGVVRGDVIACGPFTLPSPIATNLPERVVVGIRPEDVRFVGAEHEGAQKLEVALAEPLGADTHFLLRGGPIELRGRALGFDPRGAGTPVHVSLLGARLHVFAADDAGARLA